MKILSEFLCFAFLLRSPEVVSNLKSKDFLILFIFRFIILIILSIIFVLLCGTHHLKTNSFNSNYAFLSILFTAPIIEEISFRKALSFKNKDFSIGFSFFLGTITAIILNAFTSLLIGIHIEFMIIIFSLFFYFLKLYRLFFSTLKKNRLFKLYTFFSILIFVLLHFTNFNSDDYSQKLLHFSSLFITGLFLSFVRLKIGFAYSIAFHFLINSLAFFTFYFRDLNF